MIQLMSHPAHRRAAGFLRRLSPLVVLGLVAVFAASHAVAQDEQPLNRREVSRAIDIAEDHLEDAERALRNEDAEAATAAYSQAGGLFLRILQDHPYRRDIRMRLGRIYLHFEEWENVAGALDLALKTDPPSAEEDVDGWAIQNVEDAGEILEAWTALTSAYAMLENDVKVIEAGQKVIELNPNPPASTFLGLGGAMARQGQFGEAADMARRALEIEPNSALAHTTLGQASAAGEDWEAAETSFRRAVELDPNTARAHAGLADIYFAREDFQAAVDAATAALNLNDQLTAAYGIRGLANNALGNAPEAYGDLAMAITVNADDPAANLAFAQVYEAQDNKGQATTYYRKVTTLPNSPPASRVEAHIALGRFAIDSMNPDEAVTEMEAAAAADPGSAEAKAALGMAHRAKAKALRQAQDLAGALVSAEAANAANPDDPLNNLEYGIALFSNQALAEAAPLLEAAIPAFPADGDLNDLAVGHYALGQAYMGQSNFAGAESHFTEATQKMAGWGEPFRMLAWAQSVQISYGPCRLKDATFGERLQAAQVGCPASDADYERVAEAAAQYQKAVELGVQDPALAERLAVLQEVRNQLIE
jgi:tetratricopeptide (TPR) repeat protein